MARKKDSPQKAALRELMGNYLKENNVKVKDGTDVNSIMRDMMSIILEGALDQELDEELGYSKYDYRNKETDNSRNGHSQKTLHTSYGDMEIDIPRDRKGDFEWIANYDRCWDIKPTCKEAEMALCILLNEHN